MVIVFGDGGCGLGIVCGRGDARMVLVVVMFISMVKMVTMVMMMNLMVW